MNVDEAGIIILIITIFGGIILYRFFAGKDGARVQKDDLLGDHGINSRLPPSDQDGVLASWLPSGEMYKISQSDRGVVIGPPGTGKTAFLITQLRDWCNSDRSFVCLDVKPEIEAIMRPTLEEKGYKVIVYNPTNPKDSYNFLHDLASPEAVGELASSLIPADDARNAVFNESARDLLDALILHVKAHKGEDASFPDVYDTLAKYDNIKALLNDLQHSKSKQVQEIIKTLRIIADNERLLGSIFATFVSNLRFMRYDNIRNSFSSEGFVLEELCKPKVALFLQFEEASKNTTSHLFSVFVGHILRYLITHTDRGAVLNLLDEIGNAGVITDLTGKLNTIRSRNMPTWLYWQSVEQMQKYGQKANEGANIILGACDYQMIYRLNDNATAQYFADRIGLQEAKYIGISVSESSNNGGNTSTESQSIKREYVIFPHELQQLPNGTAIAIYRGIAWKGRTIPYFEQDRLLAQQAAEEEARKIAEAEAERLRLEALERRQKLIESTKKNTATIYQLGKTHSGRLARTTITKAKELSNRLKDD